MRDIIFRGKCVSDDEWIYGSLVINEVDTPYAKAGTGQSITSRYKTYRITETTYGFEDEEGFEPDYMSGIDEEVDPDTIGQYTGFKDKNGTRIFEGDIVKHHNDNPDSEIEEKGVVFWDEEYCGWRRTSNGAFHHGVVDTYRLSPSCVYEVIGNIHDNPPEIIKQMKQAGYKVKEVEDEQNRRKKRNSNRSV